MTIYIKPVVLPAWAESGDKVQPTNSEIQTGWPNSAVPPSRQRFNWILNYAANSSRYLMQRGIPEWDTGEDYPIGAYVQYSGLTYKSLLANTGSQPNTNPTNWTRWGLTQTESGALYLAKASNLSDVANAATALTNLGGVNSSFVYGRTGASGPVNFRNKIINGNFDFWQRGTSFSTPATSTYNADRWCVTTAGTVGTFTITQQTFAMGDSIRTQSTYYIRWAQTASGSSTARKLVQKIEGVRTLSNSTVTVSFLAWAAASTALTVGLTQSFGTGGSPSADVTQTGSVITLSTSPTVYTVSFTLPAVTGKTLGTGANDSLNVEFNLPLSSTFTFNLSGVQIESGGTATPFEERPIAVELSLCQRYYEVGNLAYIGYGTPGQGVASSAFFSATKRKIPVITTSNVVFTSANTLTPSPKIGGITAQVLSTTTGSAGVNFDYTADAE